MSDSDASHTGEKRQPDPTIVGARPPHPGSFFARVPRGIEILVRKASVDARFRTRLVKARAAAAADIGLELTAGEQALLTAASAEQLQAIIDATVVEPHVREAFLGKAAAVMIAALSAAPAAADEPAAADSTAGRHIEVARKLEREREQRVDSLTQLEPIFRAEVSRLWGELRTVEGDHTDSILYVGKPPRTPEGQRIKERIDSTEAAIAALPARIAAEKDPLGRMRKQMQMLWYQLQRVAPGYGTKGMRADRPLSSEAKRLIAQRDSLAAEMRAFVERRELLEDTQTAEPEEQPIPPRTRGIRPDRP